MSDNRTTELLCCPFCGGEAELRDDGETDFPFLVQCVECGGMTCGHLHADTPFGAIAAWNARADSYTREDVESAFVSGYSLGTLPVGSDPRWDQNETTLEEEMEELGWVRERTCRLIRHGSLANMPSFVCWSCSECGFGWHHSENDKQFSFCPNCGARVVGE